MWNSWELLSKICSFWVVITLQHPYFVIPICMLILYIRSLSDTFIEADKKHGLLVDPVQLSVTPNPYHFDPKGSIPMIIELIPFWEQSSWTHKRNNLLKLKVAPVVSRFQYIMHTIENCTWRCHTYSGRHQTLVNGEESFSSDHMEEMPITLPKALPPGATILVWI